MRREPDMGKERLILTKFGTHAPVTQGDARHVWDLGSNWTISVELILPRKDCW